MGPAARARTGGLLTGLANVFLLAFALDGVISLCDELVHLLLGARPLALPRALVAQLVLIAALLVYAALALSPRLPKRIFLPPIATVAWWSLGAMPLPLWLGSAAALGTVGSLIQVAVAALSLLQIRRLTHGASWLLPPSALTGPLFRPGYTLAFAAVNVLLVGPALVVYAALSLGVAVVQGTAGFIGFDREGLTLEERRYTRDRSEVVLVGMMHIGEGKAYEELFESFAQEATVVLEEGVSDESGRLDFDLSYDALASTLGLETQPGVREVIDSARAAEGADEDWPHVVNADVDISTFSAETLGFLRRIATLLQADDVPAELRRFSRYVESADPQVWRSVDRDLIRNRNRHLIGEIRNALEEYRRVVVPWGALHLPEVEEWVLADGFEQVESKQRRLLRYSTMLAALDEAAQRTRREAKAEAERER